MVERCPDCGFPPGKGLDECGVAAGVALPMYVEECRYRELEKLRSQIAKLEAVMEAQDAAIEAAVDLGVSLASVPGSHQLHAAFDERLGALETAKAELERVTNG